jgi:gamma-glutamylcyclotransferase (GGCT)/AIG2-like uncharacterized protein YtfP
MEEFILLFVYGSLKAGEPGHELMGRATFVGDMTMKGLKLIPHDYPSAVIGEGTVSGEVYAVPVSSLLTLDAYEGSNYQRIERYSIHLYVLKEETKESATYATMT